MTDFLPHPKAKGAVKASLVFVKNELPVDHEGARRVTIEFPNSDDPQSKLYKAQKVGMYISQKGRSTILYLDEHVYKVGRIRKVKGQKPDKSHVRQWAPPMLKIDIQQIEMENAHFEAIKKIVSTVI
jgi:hypothetical protein